MNISFDGIGEVVATFVLEEGSALKAGQAAVLTGNGQVGLGKPSEKICGVTLSVAEDGYAGVQIQGVALVEYTGTAPTVGWQKLLGNGAGKVSVSENGMDYLVIAVDKTASTAVIKL